MSSTRKSTYSVDDPACYKYGTMQLNSVHMEHLVYFQCDVKLESYSIDETIGAIIDVNEVI